MSLVGSTSKRPNRRGAATGDIHQLMVRANYLADTSVFAREELIHDGSVVGG